MNTQEEQVDKNEFVTMAVPLFVHYKCTECDKGEMVVDHTVPPTIGIDGRTPMYRCVCSNPECRKVASLKKPYPMVVYTQQPLQQDPSQAPNDNENNVIQFPGMKEL